MTATNRQILRVARNAEDALNIALNMLEDAGATTGNELALEETYMGLSEAADRIGLALAAMPR